MFLISPQVLAQVPLSTSTIAAMVEETELTFGLDNRFYNTLACESAGFENIQSEVPHEGGPNGREDSWGVAQIHLPAHPKITQTEALDPHFAIPWAAHQFAIGNATIFSCYDMLFGTSTVV